MSILPVFRKWIKNTFQAIGTVTSSRRILPDFLLIGTMKSGTTSLFNNLVKHPNIRRPLFKELRFFTLNYKRDINQYQRYFPLKLEKQFKSNFLKQPFITGEATPDYFFHPHAPPRIKRTLPNAKFILLLRNPVDRAFSHYYHLYNLNLYNISFKEAIQIEMDHFKEYEEALFNKPEERHPNYLRYSILERGKYIKHLKRWLEYFNRDQFLIIQNERFFEYPEAVYKETLDFLNMPQPKRLPAFKTYNKNTYDIDPVIRKWLKEFYKPFNEELFQYLDFEYTWD